MKKTFIAIIPILGILVFLSSTNFRFGNDNQGNTKWTVMQSDTNRLRSHDVFNDYNPNLVIPPYIYYPPSPDNPLIFSNVNISANSPAPQNEPSVKISHKNPNFVVAAWRDFRINYNPAYRRVGYSRSTDGGTTWMVSKLIDSTLLGSTLLRNSDASVTVDTGGNFFITTIALDNSNGNTTLAIYKSTDGGNTFPTGQSLAQGNSEDKEMVTTDLSPSSPFRNNIYVTWSRLSLSPDIYCIRSTNDGTTWQTPVVVSSAATGGDQGSDPCVGPQGQVYVVFVNANTWGTQYFNKSTNGGVSFGTPITLATGAPASIPWSQSGPTTFPSVACDISGGARNGYVYVTWCDGRNGDADVFFIRSTDQGTTWSSPLRVNNDGLGNGKVQAWPWISVNDAGGIAITFYDTRNTPNNNTIEAWVARSNDGGLTFTNDVLSSQQSPTNQPNTDVRFGDYIGIDSWGGRTVPVWTDERAGGYDMEIYTAVMTNVIPAHDISCGPFTSLPTGFVINTAYAIKTKATNVGTTAESNIPIRFYINGTLTNTNTITALAPNQTDSVSNTWTPTVAGSYTLKYISALSTDTTRYNDTIQTTVTVYTTLPTMCPFSCATPTTYTSISGTGGPTGDDAGLAAPIGFTFTYKGNSFTQAWICTNGFIQLGASGSTAYINDLSATASVNLIAGFWDDLIASAGQIQYTTQGTAPNRIFIVQFTTVPFFSGTGTVTFQIKLYESPAAAGSVEIIYGSATNNAAATGSVGINVTPGGSGNFTSITPGSSGCSNTTVSTTVANNSLPYTNLPSGTHYFFCPPVGISNNQNNVPTVYALSQNYPNPFNPETKIQFALPKAGQVKLVVYDILGAEVKTLVNEYRQAGYHSVTFNGENLASGVYFYKIESGDFINVKKMVLVK